MADRINLGTVNYNNWFHDQPLLPENDPPTASVQPAQNQTKQPKLPRVKNYVSFTALGCNTEMKLARAAFMAAAAKAGIADTAAQGRYADQMLAGISGLQINEKPIDDADVKSKLLNRDVFFTLDETQRVALENFRGQYVKDGGNIKFNRTPTIDLREARTTDGVSDPLNSTPVKKISVLLNNDGRSITAGRVLAQYAENTYGGGNLWGDNYRQIGELSAGQGISPKITKITDVGNKKLIEFELSNRDRAVIHENYKTVQAEVNRARAAYEDFANNNEISSFLRGVFNGAVGAVKNTVGLLNLPETMKAIWQIVSSPKENFNALYNELGETWEEFKNAPPNKKSEMIGELVGAAVVEILLGKGIGKAGSILAKTKTGAKLLEKAGDLKSVTAAKIAETFSDEAASAASSRLRQRLNGVQLYGGIPADMLADFAVVSANKIKNGAVKFADFTKQMVDDFGEKVRPHLEKLYREKMTELGLANNIDEVGVENLKYVRPEPGTPEHKALRWSEYEAKNQTNPKKLSYETWSKVYDVNMQQASKSNLAVQNYRNKLGWGETEKTVEVETGIFRRLDIADVKVKKAIEHKTGYISLDADIRWELERDKKLVKQGWEITWHFEGTASVPLIDALKEAGIKVTYK